MKQNSYYDSNTITAIARVDEDDIILQMMSIDDDDLSFKKLKKGYKVKVFINDDNFLYNKDFRI